MSKKFLSEDNAWDSPPSRYRLATRFWIEKFGYPVTPVRTEHLKEGPLDDFHVVILPDGGDYERYLDKNVERLKSWVGRGGVLVGFGRANRFLSEQSLLATTREYRANSDDAGEENCSTVGSELASLEDTKPRFSRAERSQLLCRALCARK